MFPLEQNRTPFLVWETMQTTQILSETVVRCSEASSLPGKPTQKTLLNWRTKGIVNRHTGRRYTLEWAMLGGAPVTSLEAFQRFLEKINEG